MFPAVARNPSVIYILYNFFIKYELVENFLKRTTSSIGKIHKEIYYKKIDSPNSSLGVARIQISPVFYHL